MQIGTQCTRHGKARTTGEAGRSRCAHPTHLHWVMTNHLLRHVGHVRMLLERGHGKAERESVCVCACERTATGGWARTRTKRQPQERLCGRNTPEILVVDRQTARGGWRGARRRVRVSGEQVMWSSMRAAEMRGGAVRVASHLLPTPPCHAGTGIK